MYIVYGGTVTAGTDVHDGSFRGGRCPGGGANVWSGVVGTRPAAEAGR